MPGAHAFRRDRLPAAKQNNDNEAFIATSLAELGRKHEQRYHSGDGGPTGAERELTIRLRTGISAISSFQFEGNGADLLPVPITLPFASKAFTVNR